MALAAPAGRLFVETYLAVLGLGAVAVPLNRRAPAAELERELRAVEPTVAVVDELRDPGAQSRLSGVTTVLEAADDEAIAGQHQPAPAVDTGPDDPAVLLFTSGTAGAPRPAVLSHRNLLANLENVERRRSILGPGDTTVVSVPLFHVMGLNSILGAALRNGVTVVFRDTFDAATMLEAVEAHGATVLVGPPALWAALAAADPGHGPLSTVTTAVSAAAPLTAEIVEATREVLGLELTQGYGLTEAAPTVALGLGLDCPPLSVGLPVPGVDVRLVDDDGVDVQVGDPGEIVVAGANVFSGYWRDPEATAEVLRDGWLHTGDVGVVDDGWLYVVDRRKELILVSGFNVHPGEVEAALATHPGVDAAAAVGRPDERTGERVVAHVVAAAGARPEADELIAHCRGLLAGHKCPREEIVFTAGSTMSINLVAHTWGRQNLREGDEILLNVLEHHANIVPWQLIAQERGATLKYLPLTPDGRLDLDRFEEALTPQTKLMAVTGMSNVLGTIPPLEEIVPRCRANGTRVLVDAAQVAPHAPIDVRKLDVDFLVFSGHKLFGPSGVGVLYGKRDLLEAMPPFLGGGHMIDQVFQDHSTWAELPAKFEAGTPPIAPIVGLGAALDYVTNLGWDAIHHHETQLLRHATEVLSQIPGLTVLGPAPEHKGAIVSFTVDGLHPHDLADWLDRRGVAVRAGHHCTMPLHEHLGIHASTRASFVMYNTLEEVDALAEAIRYTLKKHHLPV